MKKIISFSLWGDDPKYCVGAVKNSDLALIHYPGWICRFHIGTSTPAKYIKELQERENVEVVLREESGDWASTLWRFDDAMDSSVEIMISRDTDSRLNEREKFAVDEWIKSGKSFHIMRDHPYHAIEILAGMFGVRYPTLINLGALIGGSYTSDYWQVDQDFLKQKVYPLIKGNCLVHDPFFEKKPFPTVRNIDSQFVGQPFNADDTEFDPAHSQIIRSLEGRK